MKKNVFKWRKAVCLLSAYALAVSLAACGGGSSGGSATPSGSSSVDNKASGNGSGDNGVSGNDTGDTSPSGNDTGDISPSGHNGADDSSSGDGSADTGTSGNGTGDNSVSGNESENTGTSDSSFSTDNDQAGTSDETTGDVMPVVACAFPSLTNTSDAPMVEDAINQILAEKYGIQCSITFIDVPSWSEQSEKLLSSTDVDVICLYQRALATYVSEGAVVDLTDYLAASSSDMQKKFTEVQWSGTRIDGRQYAIPNLRNYGNAYYAIFNEEMFYGLGYTYADLADIDTLEEIEAVLYQACETYPDVYTIVPQNSDTMVNGLSWDGLGDQNYVGVLGNCGQDTQVTDIFECKDYIDFCTMVYKWNQELNTLEDTLANENIGTAMVKNGEAFACLSSRSCEPPPEGCVQARLLDSWSDSTNISVLTYGINSRSKDPDAAWTMLEVLYCDADVQTLLINGIQDVHYVSNWDGTVTYPEGVDAQTSTYAMQSMYWMLPYANYTVSPIVDLGSATFFSDLIDFNNRCTPSIATGIVIDYSAMGVENEYLACKDVVDQYYKILLLGLADPEVVMEQAHQAMLDAGVQAVIDAKQEVLNRFLENK